jgi:hypothetical protein
MTLFHSLVLYGGFVGSSAIDSVYVYDVTSKNWTQGTVCFNKLGKLMVVHI